MSEVAAARGYILGFLDGLRLSNNPLYEKFNVAWDGIDAMEDDTLRHQYTIRYYESLAFPKKS